MLKFDLATTDAPLKLEFIVINPAAGNGIWDPTSQSWATGGAAGSRLPLAQVATGGLPAQPRLATTVYAAIRSDVPFIPNPLTVVVYQVGSGIVYGDPHTVLAYDGTTPQSYAACSLSSARFQG